MAQENKYDGIVTPRTHLITLSHQIQIQMKVYTRSLSYVKNNH